MDGGAAGGGCSVRQTMTGTYAAATVPTEKFAFHHVSTRLDGVTWKSEATACTERGSMVVWISGSDSVILDGALAADPSIASHALLIDDGRRCLYRLAWAPSAGIMTLIDVLSDHEGMIRSAAGAAAGWDLQFRLPTQDGLSAVAESCTAHDIQLEITALREFDGEQRGHVPLTRPQIEALCAGYEHGYFQVPRATNLKEFADELDISHQALSERLRRGLHGLFSQMLPTDRTGEADETSPDQKETTSLFHDGDSDVSA